MHDVEHDNGYPDHLDRPDSKAAVYQGTMICLGCAIIAAIIGFGFSMNEQVASIAKEIFFACLLLFVIGLIFGHMNFKHD